MRVQCIAYEIALSVCRLLRSLLIMLFVDVKKLNQVRH